jgi:acetyltransferase-like isoleucine patch superfamily enzyme
MLKYFLGKLKLLHRFRRISLFAFIDNKTVIKPTARIYRMVKLIQSSVGDYTYIAPGTQVVYAEIGKYCSVAPNVSIGLPMHPTHFLSMSPLFYARKNALGIPWSSTDSFTEFRKVVIGNDVWIGQDAKIMGGVKIGHGAVIGAGAIVAKDIPDFAIAVGVPAKVIKYRFPEEVVREILHLAWWDLAPELLQEKLDIFNRENPDIEILKNITQRG